jgi:hypothetical protein
MQLTNFMAMNREEVQIFLSISKEVQILLPVSKCLLDCLGPYHNGLVVARMSGPRMCSVTSEI